MTHISVESQAFADKIRRFARTHGVTIERIFEEAGHSTGNLSRMENEGGVSEEIQTDLKRAMDRLREQKERGSDLESQGFATATCCPCYDWLKPRKGCDCECHPEKTKGVHWTKNGCELRVIQKGLPSAPSAISWNTKGATDWLCGECNHPNPPHLSQCEKCKPLPPILSRFPLMDAVAGSNMKNEEKEAVIKFLMSL